MVKQIEELNGKKKWATIIVDWDSTCVDGRYPEHGDWLRGAREALRKLLEQGYRVRIHSCRTHRIGWDERSVISDEQRMKEINYILDMLDKAGLHEVELITSVDKPSALWYIDDRSIGFRGNWRKVLREIGT